MCECKSENNDLFIYTKDASLWVYDYDSEFILDFEIKYCPFCGDRLYSETEKLEMLKVCQEHGHCWTWMPLNKRACVRCGAYEDIKTTIQNNPILRESRCVVNDEV